MRRIASVASDHSYHTPIDKIQTKRDAQEPSTSHMNHAVEQKTPEKQQPQQPFINGTPEKILDLIKRDSNGDVKCLVKYKGMDAAKWILADEIRYKYPLLLIDYYETRIILRKNQCEMAFDCTEKATDKRKLVVITSK